MSNNIIARYKQESSWVER